MIRVAIIIPRIDQLGPVKLVRALVNRLSGFDDLQLKVFYLDKRTDPELIFNVPSERLIPRKFCFGEFDIVHTNGIRPDLFAFLNRKKIRYHISTIHNLVFEDLTFTYNRLISIIFGNLWLLLWRKADKLVCISTAMKTYYEKWFASSELEVIHNGIENYEKSLLPGDEVIKVIESFHSKGFKIIGSAGILTKRKGIDQLLYLASEVNDLAVIIIGGGKELTTLKKLASRLKITDRCLFCGFRSMAVKYFSSLDLFIMPSRSEGFGLALVEAVQQKIPVICSDIKVFRELFNSGEVTFFKLDDRKSLKSSVYSAIENGKMKADSAYLRYLNNYTDRIMAEKYYRTYHSMIQPANC